MTEDERLINENWPLIRDTFLRLKPMLEGSGLWWHLQGKSVKEQMSFWLTMSEMGELVDEEVVAAALQIREQTT